MPVTIVKEDGSGLLNANSYASLADGDAYAESRLYTEKWAAATEDNRSRALVTATSLIDTEFQFRGYKSNPSQSLQWPRYQCPDPDLSDATLYGPNFDTPYLPDNAVPKVVVDATCEMAIRLLTENRMANPQGAAGGVKSVDVAGAIAVEFMSGVDPLPTIPREVANALWKYAFLVGGASGTVKITRT